MSLLPFFIFVIFVGMVLWLSFYFAKQTKTSQGYFAANGEIHWVVNGIAFPVIISQPLLSWVFVV